MELSHLILTPKLDNVTLTAPLQKPRDVSLCITSHHIIFSTRREGVEELWLMHDNIDIIEKKSISNVPGGTLIIKCKDFRVIQLGINFTADFLNVATSLDRLTSIDNIKLKYAFFYRMMYPILEDGWTAFTTDSEFLKLVKGDDWRLSHVNSDFSVCPSYPKSVIVPKSIDDATLLAASRFREGGRFPVLSYRHGNGAALLRGSQPLTGPTNKRSKEDERLINSVTGAQGRRGYILDTRAQTIAQAAKARGGGFEMEMHYPQWKRVNNPIDKVSALLESLSKLVDACNDPSLSPDKWLSKLDSSNWMTYLKDALNCACLVAQFLDQEGAPVLVHGGEGTDATLLVTSVTQIILNPDCRTVRGFEAVIEREWIQAGYPFARRHLHSAYCPSQLRTKTVAPIFLLFLDCVYQIHYQFTSSFEFLPSFLIMLFENSYYSHFGTFLGNNEKEREMVNLQSNTTSLWSYVNRPEVLQTILNPLYEPNNSVIWPSVAPMSLNLWSGMYLRWIVDQKADRQLWEGIARVKEREKELRLEAGRLRRQVEEGLLVLSAVPAPAQPLLVHPLQQSSAPPQPPPSRQQQSTSVESVSHPLAALSLDSAPAAHRSSQTLHS